MLFKGRTDIIEQAFIEDSVKKNHYALKVITLLITVIEVFNIVRVLYFSKSGLGTLNNRIYFGMYCALLFSAITVTVLDYLLRNRKTAQFRLYIGTAYFWMIWHVLLNSYDLIRDKSSGTIVFLTAIFGIAVFIQMPPIYCVIAYVISHALFLSLSIQSIDLGTMINVTITVIVGMFVSITRYRHAITSLTQNMEIETMNNWLQEEQIELRLSLEKYEIIMQQSNEIIFEWDINVNSLKFSQNCQREFGYPLDIPQAKQWILEEFGIYEEDRQQLLDTLKRCVAEKCNEEMEFRLKHISGEWVWYCAHIFLQYNEEGMPITAIGLLLNINKQKQQLEKLKEQLQTDQLTGILNKVAFQNSMQQLLPLIPKGKTLAMFMLDLDDFKSINDKYGHPCGDYVLIEAAKAMRIVFRESDLLGRLGGDEFAVALSGIKDNRIIIKKANQLLKEIAKIKIENEEFAISSSVGITVTKNGEMTYQELYKNADNALYKAKRLGKGRYHILE